jgi:hypothetical protein
MASHRFFLFRFYEAAARDFTRLVRALVTADRVVAARSKTE